MSLTANKIIAKLGRLALLICVALMFALVKADGPRIDTFYDTPEGQKYSYMNILLTWERIPNGVGDINATLFFLFQQPSSAYEGGIGFADGKISLRQQDRRRFATFSISDSHFNSKTVNPEREMAWCRRFQNNLESGSQCMLEYNWEEGKIYMLQIKLVGKEGYNDIWQASVIDVKSESESIIGRLYVDRVDMQQGYGLISENPVTYLEYFGVSNYCHGLLPVRVSWLGPFDNKANPLPIGARSQQNECNAAAASTNEHPVVIQELAVPPSNGFPNGTDFWPYLTNRYYKPAKKIQQKPRSIYEAVPNNSAFPPTNPTNIPANSSVNPTYFPNSANLGQQNYNTPQPVQNQNVANFPAQAPASVINQTIPVINPSTSVTNPTNTNLTNIPQNSQGITPSSTNINKSNKSPNKSSLNQIPKKTNVEAPKAAVLLPAKSPPISTLNTPTVPVINNSISSVNTQANISSTSPYINNSLYPQVNSLPNQQNNPIANNSPYPFNANYVPTNNTLYQAPNFAQNPSPVIQQGNSNLTPTNSQYPPTAAIFPNNSNASPSETVNNGGFLPYPRADNSTLQPNSPFPTFSNNEKKPTVDPSFLK